MSESHKNINDVDVLIFGAGVNGAGLFRDLCMQGVRCALIDKSDYASGTSAAPSRLIHGGLKYLETGEFGLVEQSTLERNLLLKNAPHLVTPLPSTIPAYSRFKGVGAAVRTLCGSVTAPRSRGSFLIRMGLAIYDWYGRREQVMPKYQWHNRKATLCKFPSISPTIVGAGTYYDAKINSPERLVWELISDGLKASPRSVAYNRCTLNTVSGNQYEFSRPDLGTLSMEPKLIANATGPWIDRVNASLGHPTQWIGGTKGSHIILDHPKLVSELDGGMIYFEADDGRVCLVFDYLGRALVGSTDIPNDEPDSVQCSDAEIDYLLESLRQLLPKHDFDKNQIIFAYSGIRPLPSSNASEPGLISRDHSAPWLEPSESHPIPIVSLIGGKWTTFRGFAEEVADTILQRLDKKRIRSTRELSIGGGANYPTDLNERHDWLQKVATQTEMDIQRVEILFERYGTTASAIAQFCSDLGDAKKVADAPDYSLSEIRWIIRFEHVSSLSDIVMRRSVLAIKGDLTVPGILSIADVAVDELNWDASRANREIEELKTDLVCTYSMWKTHAAATGVQGV